MFTQFSIFGSDLLSPAGHETIVLYAAVSVICTYSLAWLTYVALRYDRSEWLARLFDGESYPSGSLAHAIYLALVAKLGGSDSVPATNARSSQRGASDSNLGRYQIDRRLGRGDLCDVYQASVARERFVLKVPFVRTTDCLVAKEQRVLTELRQESIGQTYEAYLPEPVGSFASEGRLVSVHRFRDGFFTAGQLRTWHSPGLEGRHIAWMFNRTLEVIGFVHRCGWVHGGVLPPHLLFDPQSHSLQLIGWIHAEPIDLPLTVVPREYESWYPDRSKRCAAASAATDIHLAAKSMIWLAGGDPLSNELPDHFPKGLATFLKGCTNGRQQEAWAVHEQFRELLEDLYGPPKFCHLTMP